MAHITGTDRAQVLLLPDTVDDYVDSKGLADSVRVCALNEPEQWGSSDHCRLEIEIS